MPFHNRELLNQLIIHVATLKRVVGILETLLWKKREVYKDFRNKYLFEDEIAFEDQFKELSASSHGKRDLEIAMQMLGHQLSIHQKLVGLIDKGLDFRNVGDFYNTLIKGIERNEEYSSRLHDHEVFLSAYLHISSVAGVVALSGSKLEQWSQGYTFSL